MAINNSYCKTCLLVIEYVQKVINHTSNVVDKIHLLENYISIEMTRIDTITTDISKMTKNTKLDILSIST